VLQPDTCGYAELGDEDYVKLLSDSPVATSTQLTRSPNKKKCSTSLKFSPLVCKQGNPSPKNKNKKVVVDDSDDSDDPHEFDSQLEMSQKQAKKFWSEEKSKFETKKVRK
jgi:hypothetical protein